MAEHKPTPNTPTFAVIRLDDFLPPEVSLESRFAVTKVFITDEAAEQEASRPNALAGDEDVRYVVHITRLDER